MLCDAAATRGAQDHVSTETTEPNKTLEHISYQCFFSASLFLFPFLCPTFLSFITPFFSFASDALFICFPLISLLLDLLKMFYILVLLILCVAKHVLLSCKKTQKTKTTLFKRNWTHYAHKGTFIVKFRLISTPEVAQTPQMSLLL